MYEHRGGSRHGTRGAPASHAAGDTSSGIAGGDGAVASAAAAARRASRRLRRLSRWRLTWRVKLIRAQVDRVQHLARRVPRAERDALEMERGLRHLGFGDRRVALLGELHLQLGELRNLPRDLSESA